MKYVAGMLGVVMMSTIVSARGPAATGLGPAVVQEKSGPSVTFRMPDKYMPMEFPSYKGTLLLDPERPAGMFIVYVPGGETATVTIGKIRDTVRSMFTSGKAPSVWTVVAAPAHESKPNETAELATVTGETSDVQVFTATLPNSGNTVIYGYFAMRHNTKPQGDDGNFLQADGTGVHEFDEFRSTIKPGAAPSRESA